MDRVHKRQKSATHMKFQPKRFVVEIKRGTSRASFTSADTVSDRFNDAEELLFGGNVKTASPFSETAKAAPGPAGGRILRSLIEPPPTVPDLPEPARRGRKPGSKNKPKVGSAFPLPDAAPASAISALASRFETGPERVPARSDTAATPRLQVEPVPNDPGAGPDRPATARTASPARVRLRHRSSILKRYVLDVDPSPGQAGSLRAWKAARASR